MSLFLRFQFCIILETRSVEYFLVFFKCFLCRKPIPAYIAYDSYRPNSIFVHSFSHPQSTVFSNVLIMITIANPDRQMVRYRFVFLAVFFCRRKFCHQLIIHVEMKLTHVAGKTWLLFHSCTANMQFLCCNSLFFYGSNIMATKHRFHSW